MDDAVLEALATDKTIDITTTGRTSGRARRIEIWYHRVGDRFYLSALPGWRGWYANLEVNPALTFHLKESTLADLPATATPITDEAERRRIFSTIVGNGPEYEAWVAGSVLAEVTFDAELTESVRS